MNKFSIILPLIMLITVFSVSISFSAEQKPPAVLPSYPLSQPELDKALSEIRGLIDQSAFLEAQARYQTLLGHDLEQVDREAVQRALESLNVKILFSPLLTDHSVFYTVEPGDALYKIAKKHNTTVDLIKKSNDLQNDVIRPGMKLKVSTANFSIKVDKTSHQLLLFADNELLKTYPVATGKGERTPIGTFTIENKLENPTWYKAGAIVPPDSPDNILGTRWMGFSLASYGIHGTTIPESIGTDATEGCVRMYNQDVEELYSIVPVKTEVTVVE